MKRLYVHILEDHTISMGPRLAKLALQDLNEQINALKSLVSDNFEVFVSTLRMEGAYTTAPSKPVAIESYEVDRFYGTHGSYTDLYDQSCRLLESAMVQYAADPQAAQLVMIFTDGADNSSSPLAHEKLTRILKNLDKNDQFTITARVPVGIRSTMAKFGFDPENVLEWQTTESGYQASAVTTQTSLRSHVQTYATTGVAKSKSFYTTDATKITQSNLNALDDISADVFIFPVTEATQIRPFVEKRLGRTMVRGSAYYELKKKETVQPQKLLIIRDKQTKKIYAGQQARDLLGLPSGSSIKVAPGAHGNYDIYVQSTSVNRKLDIGAELIYWEDKKGPSTVGFPPAYQPPVVQQVAQAPQLDDAVTRLVNKIQVAPAAKKTPVTAKKVPTKKTRNRNTEEQQIREFVNNKAPSPRVIRELRNYTSLQGTLGFDKVKLSQLKDQACMKFSAHRVSMADFLAAKTLGDIVTLIKHNK